MNAGFKSPGGARSAHLQRGDPSNSEHSLVQSDSAHRAPSQQRGVDNHSVSSTTACSKHLLKGHSLPLKDVSINNMFAMCLQNLVTLVCIWLKKRMETIKLIQHKFLALKCQNFHCSRKNTEESKFLLKTVASTYYLYSFS